MFDRLLPYYQSELEALKRLAGEFAEANPKVAGHLRLAPGAVDDPHVLRLLVPLHSGFDRLAPEAVRSGKGCFQAERCSGRGLGKDNSRRSGLGSDQ